MITLRKAMERRHDRGRKRESWLTFFPENGDGPLADGFGTLELLDEGRLSPGGRLPDHRPRDAEIVTFVREGALAWEDSLGQSGVIQAGEFRRTTSARRVRHHESNASSTDSAHFFQIWLRPSQADLEQGDELKRFSAAERRGGLCVIGSPDGRRGSLRIHQDALVLTALLLPGTHVIHELALGRSAWLHVIAGEATLGEVVLSTGDGVGLTAERAVSLTARRETEILLLDLRDERESLDPSASLARPTPRTEAAPINSIGPETDRRVSSEGRQPFERWPGTCTRVELELEGRRSLRKGSAGDDPTGPRMAPRRRFHTRSEGPSPTFRERTPA